MCVCVCVSEAELEIVSGLCVHVFCLDMCVDLLVCGFALMYAFILK